MSPWISNFIRFRIYMYWASLLATIFIYISFSFIMRSVENFLAIKYFRWMDGLLFLQLSCRTIPILLWIEPIVHLHYICKQCISFRYWFVILCTRTENRRHFSLQFKYLLQNNASIFLLDCFFLSIGVDDCKLNWFAILFNPLLTWNHHDRYTFAFLLMVWHTE